MEAYRPLSRLLLSKRALFTYFTSFTMFTKRFGNFQPFARTQTGDDGRYRSGQLGFITYSGDTDEQYQVSYVEAGARSDHANEVGSGWTGGTYEPLSVDAPIDSDTELLRDKDGKSVA